jgi:hypothetical protein
MTISEQLREAALYARDPWCAMRMEQFNACCQYKADDGLLCGLPDTQLRTFMLLVAEALE